MMMKKYRWSLTIMLCVGFWGSLRAQQDMYKVSGEMARLLQKAEEALAYDQPAEALRILQEYEGQDHVMRQMLLGHVYTDLERLNEAEKAYRSALALEEGMKPAGLALACLQARREKWESAARLLGQFVNVDQAGAEHLMLYARVAYELENYRLCRLLVNKGMMRFPLEEDFRRLDLQLTLVEEDSMAAFVALRERVQVEPGNASHWRNLAVHYSQRDRPGKSLAAWEAAVLCDPCDLELRKNYVSMLLQEGDWFSVTQRGLEYFGKHNNKMDFELAGIFIQAAEMGRRDDLLRKWLDMIPADKQTRTIIAAGARLALRRDEPERARKALMQLIAMGDVNFRIFLTAGHLAESMNDTLEAEIMYKQALKMDDPHADTAWLYLARLAAQQEKYQDAGLYVNKYLRRHPEDHTARNLELIIKNRVE